MVYDKCEVRTAFAGPVDTNTRSGIVFTRGLISFRDIWTIPLLLDGPLCPFDRLWFMSLVVLFNDTPYSRCYRVPDRGVFTYHLHLWPLYIVVSYI